MRGVLLVSGPSRLDKELKKPRREKDCATCAFYELATKRLKREMI